MPSPERPGGTHRKEHEPLPYYQAARFAGEQPAGQAYFAAQEALYDEPDCDLSVYRLQIDRISHVVVLGDPPPQELEQELQTILSTGEPASLSPEVLRILRERRARAIKRGLWVERHYRPGKQL